MVSGCESAFLNPCPVENPVGIKTINPLKIFICKDFLRNIVPGAENLYACQTTCFGSDELGHFWIHMPLLPMVGAFFWTVPSSKRSPNPEN